MKKSWQEFKIFLLVFITLSVIFFIIFNGAAFASLLRYKSQTLWQSFKEEILRPPKLAFWKDAELNKKNQSILETEKNHKNNLPSNNSQNQTPTKPGVQNLNVKETQIPQWVKDEILKNPSQNLLIMPQFKISAPIWTVESYSLSVIYKKLRQGVVIFPSSQPIGEGQTIIIGHSSAYPWEPGRFKSVFSLLSQYRQDDEIYVWWNNNLYIYKVVTKKIFLPWPKGDIQTEHLFPSEGNPTLVLQSCWPVGVDSRRIAVLATLSAIIKSTPSAF